MIKLIQTPMLKGGLLKTTAQLLSIPRNTVFQVLQEPRTLPLLSQSFLGCGHVSPFPEQSRL